MTFRRTRRTNDWLAWLTFGACLLGAVLGNGIAIAIWVVSGGIDAGHLCFGSLAIGFTAVSGITGWQLFHPEEWEFVVDGDVIRWGRAVRPDRQQRLRLADIKRVVNDRREQRVVVETGSGRTVAGDFVLIRKADQLAFIAFLKQHHPEIAIDGGP